MLNSNGQFVLVSDLWVSSFINIVLIVMCLLKFSTDYLRMAIILTLAEFNGI